MTYLIEEAKLHIRTAATTRSAVQGCMPSLVTASDISMRK